MTGHVTVSQRSDAALKTSLANLRLAYVKRWRVEETRAAVPRVITTKPQKQWVSEEEAARIGRPRSLLDDNPAAG